MANSVVSEVSQVLSGGGSGVMSEVGIPALVFAIVYSVFCAFFCSFLYVKFYSRNATGSQVHRAFPLLGLSITSIFLCVQFSLPLSLGLLGALSIVRFRTPIKEPEEIAFIMLVVAVSIGCATFSYALVAAILGIAVVALLVAAYGPRFLVTTSQNGMAIIRLPEAVYMERHKELFEWLRGVLRRGTIDGVTKDGEEYVISFNFSSFKGDGIPELQSSFQRMFGTGHLDVFLNRPRPV